jgi:hypothetical protein
LFGGAQQARTATAPRVHASTPDLRKVRDEEAVSSNPDAGREQSELARSTEAKEGVGGGKSRRLPRLSEANTRPVLTQPVVSASRSQKLESLKCPTLTAS